MFLLKYWAGRCRNLKTVVFPISFFSWFSHGLETSDESYRCRYYKIYMDCDLYSDLSLYNLELSDYRTAKGKITKLFTPDTNPGYNEYGWGNTYKLSEKKMDEWNDGSEAEAAIRRHTIENWDNIDHNYAMMKEFADFCKSHNIQMVLVTTPCWSSYYDNLFTSSMAGKW